MKMYETLVIMCSIAVALVIIPYNVGRFMNYIEGKRKETPMESWELGFAFLILFLFAPSLLFALIYFQL